MKKISLVLLIAVLATSFAFAATAFTGSANLNLGYNFDSTDWGFKNVSGTSVKLDVVLDSRDVVKTGKGDLYAVIAANFKFKFDDTKLTKDTKNVKIDLTAKITKANIIYKDFVFGILNAGGGQSYAAPYYKVTVEPKKKDFADRVAIGEKMAPGFTVSYKGYTGGFGAEGNAKADTYKVFGNVETKAFELAEGMTLQAAGYGFISNSGKELGASAKYAYKADKMEASLGVDTMMAGKKDFHLEAAAKFAFKPVTVDVYYYTVDGQFKDHNLDAKVAVAFEEQKANAYVDVKNIFDLPAVAAPAAKGNPVERFARSLELGGDITFDAVKVDAKFTAPLFASPLKKFTKFDVEANVTYTHEKFVVTGGLEFGMAADMASKKLQNVVTLSPSASISSKAIIDNAEIALTWGDNKGINGGNATWEPKANFAPKAVSATGVASDRKATFGNVTASVKVSF